MTNQILRQATIAYAFVPLLARGLAVSAPSTARRAAPRSMPRSLATATGTARVTGAGAAKSDND